MLVQVLGHLDGVEPQPERQRVLGFLVDELGQVHLVGEAALGGHRGDEWLQILGHRLLTGEELCRQTGGVTAFVVGHGGEVTTVVGYHRYDTKAELLLLNKIWKLQSLLTNYFSPQQKLISKVRDGAKVTKRYDVATTPHRRAEAHKSVTEKAKAQLAETYTSINPAAVQRQIQALTAELLTLVTTKARTAGNPSAQMPATRASRDESTNQASRPS
jgi:hypothetical protein